MSSSPTAAEEDIEAPYGSTHYHAIWRVLESAPLLSSQLPPPPLRRTPRAVLEPLALKELFEDVNDWLSAFERVAAINYWDDAARLRNAYDCMLKGRRPNFVPEQRRCLDILARVPASPLRDLQEPRPPRTC
ncbi:hypothetical protein HPB52_015085 [Rhipicephalus sanguineus]|uniref:Uncharacterized protein n=1 Tax=Rhipicephalus sanguineus TaxID=34632 RepID=A0A9D4SYK4_RHISA|nr:hypothetical protein HPB52_015085 [Rhipicephalus sanguineus]